jgi:hypothetical protein
MNKAKVIYRALSVCAGLGYGFPEDSLNRALEQKLDLIAADAGSIDPGPYYLGTGRSYMKKANLKRDFSLMLKGALAQGCPLILGSCGLAGDDPNLEFMRQTAAEVFVELGVSDLKVAVIKSSVEDGFLLARLGSLEPLGPMPELSEENLRACRKVAQMGVAPIIQALEQGAQIILAGRACDVAVFAADPLRKGIDPGLAYHAGHILECGAMACDPGSGSDCLLAEFGDDGSVAFTPPNPQRRATTWSIAAHSLYEEDHPYLQFYPEGMLSLKDTEYFQAGEGSAGIRNSAFIKSSPSIKIEGARQAGERVVSILSCRSLAAIPGDLLVYGKNGVDPHPVEEGESELGLCLKVKSRDKEAARAMLTALKGLFMHFGYAGRRSTAGNLAFPISPNEINYQEKDGVFVSAVIAGTRDPFFKEAAPAMEQEILEILARDYKEMLKAVDIEILWASEDCPLLFLDTVATTAGEARSLHKAEIKRLGRAVDPEASPVVAAHMGGFFVWGIFHLLREEALKEAVLFPITIYRVDGDSWAPLSQTHAASQEVEIKGCAADLEDSSWSLVPEAGTGGRVPREHRPLVEMTRVIRSKNAGINKITYDIFFNTRRDYKAALSSGVFTCAALARILRIPGERILGIFQYDACLALKVSVERGILSGSKGDRDLFGAQQHTRLLAVEIPIVD